LRQESISSQWFTHVSLPLYILNPRSPIPNPFHHCNISHLLTCVIYATTAGEGPVPFTYSAEAFPLYIRNIGMSFATAVTWFFNFVVSITFPALLGAFTPQGAFGWYAAWNCVGWLAVLLAVPETKALSLEELDQGS
jgi:hypothetical protein